jgi:hypothetical protein
LGCITPIKKPKFLFIILLLGWSNPKLNEKILKKQALFYFKNLGRELVTQTSSQNPFATVGASAAAP